MESFLYFRIELRTCHFSGDALEDLFVGGVSKFLGFANNTWSLKIQVSKWITAKYAMLDVGHFRFIFSFFNNRDENMIISWLTCDTAFETQPYIRLPRHVIYEKAFRNAKASSLGNFDAYGLKWRTETYLELYLGLLFIYFSFISKSCSERNHFAARFRCGF